MLETLRSNYSHYPHDTARRTLIVRSSACSVESIESLLAAMQHFLAKAKTELLQPRQQAVNRILMEAAMLH
jgi:hypothetical protein